MRNLFELLSSKNVGCLSFQFLFGEVHNFTFRRVKNHFHINAPYLYKAVKVVLDERNCSISETEVDQVWSLVVRQM